MINNKDIIKGHSSMKMIRAVEEEIAFRYYKDQLMTQILNIGANLFGYLTL